ncbi:hypothetical protein [Mycolicibacter hiberniae]|uniref:Uncharacterized protein n=1 Tax=Mycolicibacter hiberniae TaxID=29314 RepID=A0A7I7X7C1_9MYCO|nr:hypothetical protein [Mycolicibacter hiberniae]MCV7087321.1 hypothetical protein [Mycolicibacter hiberniae]ORV67706.1 hypothetical protein AWC09_16140 [Mycolicibacter hiberniae]BBZ25464.1 hypothetical protein MHIB_38820 [Mycolicibacter hiberniae]
MHARTKTRPYALFGAALVGAGAIVTAPAVVPALPADAIAADVALTALDWPDVDVLTPDGWLTFDSLAAAQAYAEELTATTLSYAQTAVEWAGWLDPFLSFAGISGLGDWVSDRYDMFEEILSPGWNPLTWIEGLLESISADPEVLFGPVADFDLGWLYSLLGVSAQDGEQLDSLLELASGYYGGQITLGLLTVYGTGPGAINAIADGIITLDDLFPELGSELDVLNNLAGESITTWLTEAEETLTAQIEFASDVLEAAPAIQWILDLFGQLTDGGGFELPF